MSLYYNQISYLILKKINFYLPIKKFMHENLKRNKYNYDNSQQMSRKI